MLIWGWGFRFWSGREGDGKGGGVFFDVGVSVYGWCFVLPVGRYLRQGARGDGKCVGPG